MASKSLQKKNKRTTKSSCKLVLSKKIKRNMREYKQGRYSSQAQAIAVSYSQISKKKPGCKRYFKRS